MQFVVWQGQDKLADFIQDNFPELTVSDREKFEKRLRELNPELKDPSALHAGAVIRLPVLNRRTAHDQRDFVTRLSLDTLDQFDDFAAQLKTDLASERALRREEERRFDSAAFKRSLEQVQELRPLLDATRQGMKQREEWLSQTAGFVKLLPEMRAALERMLT